MPEYALALALLEEALQLMDDAGDTLIAAHLTTPLGLLQERLDSLQDPPRLTQP